MPPCGKNTNSNVLMITSTAFPPVNLCSLLQRGEWVLRLINKQAFFSEFDSFKLILLSSYLEI